MVNRVSILGCGWFGTALAVHLLNDGFDVKGSATSKEKVSVLQQRGIPSYNIRLDQEVSLLSPDSDFWLSDALIISSNVKLAANDGYRSGMQNLVQQVKSTAMKKIIFISSTSVYGDHNAVVDDHTACSPDSPSGTVLLELESLLQNIPGVQFVSLRFGGLVGPGRLPGSFFAGKKNIPNGLAPVNLIHLEDCIGITALLLSLENLPSSVNGVSPDHPSRAEFYVLAAQQQGLEVPEFIMEKTDWKIVGSSFLQERGYAFRISDWKTWLTSL